MTPHTIKVLLLFCFLACSGKESVQEETTADPNKEVVCFVYHRFGDSRFPSTNISVSDFEAHLSYLSKNDYQLLTFSEALDYLNSDSPVKKTVVLTIDDGYKSFYQNALPLLKKYNMPATLYINTETVGGADYMNWEQLKDASQHNIEIGNHSHSHPYFLNEPENTRYDFFKKELETCQSLIRAKLKITCETFAFPYGEFDEKMKLIVKEMGFKGAAAQNSGVLYGGSDRFQCPRFPMSEAYAPISKFVEKIKTRPLRVVKESPNHTGLPADRKPTLTLTIDPSTLRLNQMQCFVQGNDCNLKIIEQSEDEATIAVTAAKMISGRRRTLYTVTVPDSTGTWHWYSHLWIDPKEK